MNAVKIAGVLLIVAGILGLVYGSFSYTKETHEAKLVSHQSAAESTLSTALCLMTFQFSSG